MRRAGVFLLIPILVSFSCRKPEKKLYAVGYFQVVESDTANEARKGFIQALEDSGLRPGVNIDLEIRNAWGDIPAVQRIAQGFAEGGKDLIVAHSTSCLQAAMTATRKIPIVFLAVANPFLVNVGRSAEDHLNNVTGVPSTGPVRQTLALVKEVLPNAMRVGTLWTPSELNSEYYLNMMREAAKELGLEIEAVPVSSTSGVLPAAQALISRKIDALFPVSDNTINASFTTLGRIAEENAIPLFASILQATRSGACASLGIDFHEIGYKAGQMAVRIRNGESPARIPFSATGGIKLRLNMLAARKQGVQFPAQVMRRAEEILTVEEAKSLTENQSAASRNP